MKHIALLSIIGLVLSGCEGSGSSPSASAAASTLLEVRDLRLQHKPEEALRVADAYLATVSTEKLVGEALDLRLERVEILLLLERTEEALAALGELEGIEGPARTRLQLRRADAHAKLDDWKSALAALEAVSVTDRGFVYRRYATALEETGSSEEALAIRIAGLIRNPWDGETSLDLGRQLARAESTAAAGKRLLERHEADEPRRVAEQEALALEREGRHDRAAHRRARAEAERENLFRAMLLENQAQQINPKFGDAYIELARISLFLERTDEAITILQRLPPHAGALQLLADVLEVRGDLETAARSCESAAQLLEEGPELEKLRARIERLKSGESTLPADATTAVSSARARTREGMKGSGLSQGTDLLAALARAWSDGGEGQKARDLTLFLLAYPQGFQAGAAVAGTVLDRPGDLFYRLRASWLRGETGEGTSFEKDIAALGSTSSRVLASIEQLFPDFQAARVARARPSPGR